MISHPATTGISGIEQLRQARARMRLLAWPRRPSKNEIVAGKQRVDDLRNHCIFVSVHAGKERLVFLDGAQQIAAKFVLDGNGSGSRIEVRNAAQFTQRAGFGMARTLLAMRGASGHCGPIQRGTAVPRKFLVQSVPVSVGVLAQALFFL